MERIGDDGTIVVDSPSSSSRRMTSGSRRDRRPKIVLIAGFESFNRDLYERINDDNGDDDDGISAELIVFSNADIRLQGQRRDVSANDATIATIATSSGGRPNITSSHDTIINPEVEHALRDADAVCVSLLFDYDDVVTLMPHLERVKGPRLVFESSIELMKLNRVNSFSMATSRTTNDDDNDDDSGHPSSSSSGPPPVVRGILSLFGSSREEDKLAGYIKLLKVGPELLRYVPGEKAKDLRLWLMAYRYWNQGGEENVKSLVKLVSNLVGRNVSRSDDDDDIVDTGDRKDGNIKEEDLPPLQVTPDVGLVHPLLMVEEGDRVATRGNDDGGATIDAARRGSVRRFHFPYDKRPKYMESASEYLRWRMSPAFERLARDRGFPMARPSSSNDDDADIRLQPPRVAILLYRKHVITQQRYVLDLITMMEESGIIPIPIFINGVEAHAIVRDWLTSTPERRAAAGAGDGGSRTKTTTSVVADRIVDVDAIVSTIGFPLVGGPAGSMEAGRNVALAQELLSSMDVPYVVAAPLLLQSIRQWKDNGVLGLQSGMSYKYITTMSTCAI
jgi:magnesium chelatase subunit H